MSLSNNLVLLTNRIASEIKSMKAQIESISGGSYSGSIDGGVPNSNFGGTSPINGGGP